MTDKELIEGIQELQKFMHSQCYSAMPAIIIETEVKKLINRAGHYKALYESMCARYGADEELPLLDE